MKKIFLLALTALAPAVSHAQPSIMPLSLQHKGQIEISTGFGTGNIDSEKYKLGGKLISDHERYTNELKGSYADVDARRGNSKGVYNIGDKLKYTLSDDDYLFGDLDYVNNKASGIDSRTSEAIGYGYRLIDEGKFNLTGEAAAGLRQNRYKPGLRDENSALGKLGTDMNWEVYNNVNLNNNTYIAFTEDNRQTVSDTSVKTFVYKTAYVKGSFLVENNEEKPAGYKNTDTVTSVGLGYEF